MAMERKLDKILDNVEVIKEDVRPSEGIWYYIYLYPDWELIPVLATEYGGYGHEQFWARYLAPKIVDHYELGMGTKIYRDSAIRKIRELHLSMPRGRVSAPPKQKIEYAGTLGEKGSEDPGVWYFDHGNDFPAGMILEDQQKRLISLFNVTGPAISGNVEFREVDHERMSRTQCNQMCEILKIDIPY
jgi:hypothetical protein